MRQPLTSTSDATTTPATNPEPGLDGATSAAGAKATLTPSFPMVLPALAALCVASGAGVFAVTQVVALPDFSTQAWTIWLFAMICAAVNYYGTVRRGQLPAHDARQRAWSIWQSVVWLAALTVAILPPVFASLGISVFVPFDVVSDNNLLVAVLMGWCTTACLFIGGVLLKLKTDASRPVPFSMALLPELSLFALLNIVSVDTPIMAAFMVYVAASLYLIAYENYLAHRSFDEPAQIRLTSGFSASSRDGDLLSRVRRTAGHYAVACGVWLVFFVAGASLFYKPLSIVLPGSFAADFARQRFQTQQPETRDWREASRVMELRGGSYPVSEAPVLKVKVQGGVSGSLWRGRVYELYSVQNGGTSRWEVLIQPGEATYETFPSRTNDWTELKPTKAEVVAGLKRSMPQLDPDIATSRPIVESFQLLDAFSPGPNIPVFTSGEVVAINTKFDTIALRTDGTARLTSSGRSRQHFTVRSQVIEPNLSRLSNASGLDEAGLHSWRKDPITAPTLSMPGSVTGVRLRAIANQIKRDAQRTGRPMSTPFQKANAIAFYLTNNYEYSLETPAVPPGTDSVLFFLTESKQGACDMFASSMALLLRALNVPTRVASGFRQPEMPADESELANLKQSSGTASGSISTATSSAENNASQIADGETYIVRQQDAHAWVEYFVPELGWVSSDPTTGTRVANDTLGAQVMEFLHLSQWRRQARLFAVPSLGALLLLVGGVWTLLDRRNVLRPGMLPRTHYDATRERIRGGYANARRVLARHVPASAGQTPYEYENAVLRADISVEAKLEFSALTYLFVQADYATSVSVGAVSEAALRDSLKRLRRALR